MSKLTRLTPEDYAKIEKTIALNVDTGEEYVITAVKRHGRIFRGIHVFKRLPTANEMSAYEEIASKVKFRGQKAIVEGSQVNAAVQLYNKLIDRAFDIQAGSRYFPDRIDDDTAKTVVPVMMKREAVRELIGNVTGLSAMHEEEDDEEDDKEEDRQRI